MGERRFGVEAKGYNYLARFTGTEEQHLDFVLGHHAVPLELVFNLIVACERGERRVERSNK